MMMMLADLHFDRLENIPVTGWALVVAGAAFGGAVLHANRLIGAVLVGGLTLAYELSQAPCCSGCAKGAGCGAAATASASAEPAVGLPEKTASGRSVRQQATSTAPLAHDYVGRSTSSPFDPSSVFASAGSPQVATSAGAASGGGGGCS